MFSKKLSFIILGLLSLFSLGYFSKTNAEIISSTLTDTYTINLSGIHLNNVSGLNVKIKLPRKQADITTGVTFKGTGANVLLSTVTGPSAEEYTVSLVLTGMITDGKATITGKFIENSIIPGAEFLVTSITQDGGLDLTDLLTKEIIFSNSKATPTPTATPSATPSATATPSGSGGVTATPTPSASVSAQAQDIIDLIGEDGSDIDPSEIQEALADEDKANVIARSSSSLQLKKNGLNKVFVRLNGSLGKGFLFSDEDRLSCILISIDDFLKVQNPVFSAPLTSKSNRNVKYRFSKRVALSVLPDGDGLKLLNNEIDTKSVSLFPICFTYDKADGDKALQDAANRKGKLVSSLSGTEYLFGLLDAAPRIIFGDSIDVNLLAPKTADINTRK